MKLLIDVQTLYTNERHRGIGIYTFNWVEHLLKQDTNNRYYLMKKVDDKWYFTFVSSCLDLNNRLNQNDCWIENTIENFIVENNVDLVHFTSPLMFDIEIPKIERTKVKISYLVYDMIPFVMKNNYFNEWPKNIQKKYAERCNQIKKADFILTISQSAKDDINSFLNIDKEKIHVIYASIDEGLYNLPEIETDLIETELNLTEPFFFSLTGYDFRKNNEGLIKAFSLIASKHPNVKLVIGGIKKEEDRTILIEYGETLGLGSEQLFLLGYISNETIIELYSKCLAFVFVSLYEGFGLPVLEAMRCGAPIITSNTSSLPEVAGDCGLVVDPTNIPNIASSLERLIDNTSLVKQMKEKSLNEAKKFSWDITTRKSLEVMLSTNLSANNSSTKEKPLLAYFSPLNPQKSGISDYSEELLLSLQEYFEIKIVTNGIKLTNNFIKGNFEILHYKKDKKIIYQIKNRLYHMGNNELHDWIYEALKDLPGTVVLHDLNLYGFYMYTTFIRGQKGNFADVMKYNHGNEGEIATQNLIENSIYPNSQEFPMFKEIVELSNGVIVHSNFIKDQIMASTDFKGKVEVIPLGFNMEDLKNENLLPSEKLDLNKDEFNIGVFGGIAPNRRLDIIIATFNNLLLTNSNCKLFIVGNGDENYKKELLTLVKTLGVKNKVKFLSNLDLKTFNSYINAVDICINLRWPTMGETSATLIRALGNGIPTLVSNVGSYSEYPDDITWKVDVDSYEKDLLLAYLIELVENKFIRLEMSKLATKYIEENNSFKITAKAYANFIEAIKLS